MAQLRTATQALSTSYGAIISVETGWDSVSVTLDDNAIGFTVEVASTNEEAVPAGSSWVLDAGASVTEALALRIKSASGTPTASVLWFR